VECWQPSDVEEITKIWNVITYDECFLQVQTICKIQDDRRKDIQGTAF
jgi:hypothetical protein